MIFDFHYADIDVDNGSEWFRKTLDWKPKELKELISKAKALCKRPAGEQIS